MNELTKQWIAQENAALDAWVRITVVIVLGSYVVRMLVDKCTGGVYAVVGLRMV